MNNKNILVEKKKSKKKTVSSITYTTGDPDLNIKFFNRSMGTDFSKDISSESNSLDNDNGISSEVAGEGGALTEAKRETKRYYIRPQNIFCANKSDVLKALTEIDTENSKSWFPGTANHGQERESRLSFEGAIKAVLSLTRSPRIMIRSRSFLCFNSAYMLLRAYSSSVMSSTCGSATKATRSPCASIFKHARINDAIMSNLIIIVL